MFFYGIFHLVIGTGTGIAFVSQHHFRPLPVAHSSRPGIRQQINKYIIAFEVKKIVFCLL